MTIADAGERCSLRSGQGRWLLAATLITSGTVFLMGTAVTIALPTIQSYFQTNVTGIQWVVNAQLLPLAALLLIGGSLGDRYGRKRIFMVGMIVFAGGAALSATAAQTIGLLIAFQAVMGIGAALMVPQSLALINACFEEGERGQAIGLWAGLSGGIAALGPWLGGWIIEKLSWQAIFIMPVVLTVVALVITRRVIPENRNQGTGRLDWRGTLLILLGLAGIAYGMLTGPTGGWSSPVVMASLVGGSALVALFIIAERRESAPLVPVVIFREPLVLGANIVTFLVYFALNGVTLFVTLNLQQFQGFSPAAAGLRLLPVVLIITFLSGPAGRLADRIGPRRQMILGPLVVATGIGLLATGGVSADYPRYFLPGLVLLGGGMALLIAPLTKSTLSVAPGYSGAASGVNNAVARVAALMAVAVLGAIILASFSSHLAANLAGSGLSPDEQQAILSQAASLGNIAIPAEFDKGAALAVKQAVAGAFVSAFRRAMAVSAGLALAGAFVSVRTIHNPRAESVPPPRG